ncbi:uncharacterized protein LOC108344424 [Vigna angularis]|uniref:uncharacterized protein LOC108344424 n=1 Tax=Phaseolus angularis TaxID=3914 RepID=UPI000809D879|nr:uncharacterized protein LOC108344424 [Vigna angularis]
MESQTSFTTVSVPVFDGQNYQMWVVKMEAYLDANDVWEAVEEDYEVPPLPNNLTVAQMKSHKERRLRKSKAKSILFTVVVRESKEMQALNLVRELEMQRMKDSETIKDYADKLLDIANKIRLLGTEIPDSRIVQKILVTIPERYEATLTSLENSKDLSTITLAELLTAL